MLLDDLNPTPDNTVIPMECHTNVHLVIRLVFKLNDDDDKKMRRFQGRIKFTGAIQYNWTVIYIIKMLQKTLTLTLNTNLKPNSR